MDEMFDKYTRELRIRNYSQRTVKSYSHALKHYVKYVGEIPERPDEESIKSYLLFLKDKGKSNSYLSIILNAIGFYYRELKKYPFKVNVKFPRKEKRLPVVLSKQEVKKLIDSTVNIKHRLLLSLAYGGGLRVSEVLNIKYGDIDFEHKTIHIKGAKGFKDRITIFSDKIYEDLIAFCRNMNSNHYLFVNESNKKLVSRTAQNIFKQAINRVGLTKPVTFHSLRHSFATHLIENGVNLRYVQDLLGHQSIRTTEIYTHVANDALVRVKSPL